MFDLDNKDDDKYNPDEVEPVKNRENKQKLAF